MNSEKITLYRTNEDKTEVVEQLPKTVSSHVYDEVNEQFLNDTLEHFQSVVSNISTIKTISSKTKPTNLNIGDYWHEITN